MRGVPMTVTQYVGSLQHMLLNPSTATAAPLQTPAASPTNSPAGTPTTPISPKSPELGAGCPPGPSVPQAADKTPGTALKPNQRNETTTAEANRIALQGLQKQNAAGSSAAAKAPVPQYGKQPGHSKLDQFLLAGGTKPKMPVMNITAGTLQGGRADIIAERERVNKEYEKRLAEAAANLAANPTTAKTDAQGAAAKSAANEQPGESFIVKKDFAILGDYCNEQLGTKKELPQHLKGKHFRLVDKEKHAVPVIDVMQVMGKQNGGPLKLDSEEYLLKHKIIDDIDKAKEKGDIFWMKADEKV